jgi:hypothetical protein
MKTYFNGQRKGMMYGGNVRKPMMYGGKVQKMAMGGMAEKNIKPNQSGMMSSNMGMGMMYGGQTKLDKNKDGKISGKDFAMMGKK